MRMFRDIVLTMLALVLTIVAVTVGASVIERNEIETANAKSEISVRCNALPSNTPPDEIAECFTE